MQEYQEEVTKEMKRQHVVCIFLLFSFFFFISSVLFLAFRLIYFFFSSIFAFYSFLSTFLLQHPFFIFLFFFLFYLLLKCKRERGCGRGTSELPYATEHQYFVTDALLKILNTEMAHKILKYCF